MVDRSEWVAGLVLVWFGGGCLDARVQLPRQGGTDRAGDTSPSEALDAAAQDAPALRVAPDFVDFGTVTINQPQTRSVWLSNDGGAPLHVDRLLLSGHQGFHVTIDGQTYAASDATATDGVVLSPPLTLAPGERAELAVSYGAVRAERADGSLVVMSDDPQSPAGVMVRLLANTDGPCIAISRTAIDFGTRRVGERARQELVVTSCGSSPLRIDGIQLDDPSGDFAVDLSALSFPLTLAPNATVALPVTFAPTHVPTGCGPAPSLATITFSTNAFAERYDVRVSGGVGQTCCTPRITCSASSLDGATMAIWPGDEVAPQTRLRCSADADVAGDPPGRAYQWGLVQPMGSADVILPSASSRDIEVTLNVVGSYRLQLDVTDAVGLSSCATAVFDVIVGSPSSIHVELLWRTPGDTNEADTGFIGSGPEQRSAGSDLDLHFLDAHGDRYYDERFDVYWKNPSPEWGAPGRDDDPSLDRDDSDGGGPENCSLTPGLAPAIYRVGVYYWDDWDYGRAFATVRVYIDGSLRFDSEVELVESDFWDVCEIEWPSGVVRSLADPDPQITHYYPVPGGVP